MLDLPGGLRGRVLALGLLAVLLGLVWTAAVAPLLAWHAERAELLGQRRTLADRMQALAATLPRLRSETAGSGAGPGPQALLDGGSDAVAGAALQAQLETMAAGADTAISSLELLPAEAEGAFRRVALRVRVSGTWTALIHLLGAIDAASPRMLVDDLQLQPAPSLAAGAAQPLAASFTVLAFRAGGRG